MLVLCLKATSRACGFKQPPSPSGLGVLGRKDEGVGPESPARDNVPELYSIEPPLLILTLKLMEMTR